MRLRPVNLNQPLPNLNDTNTLANRRILFWDETTLHRACLSLNTRTTGATKSSHTDNSLFNPSRESKLIVLFVVDTLNFLLDQLKSESWKA